MKNSTSSSTDFKQEQQGEKLDLMSTISKHTKGAISRFKEVAFGAMIVASSSTYANTKSPDVETQQKDSIVVASANTQQISQPSLSKEKESIDISESLTLEQQIADFKAKDNSGDITEKEYDIYLSLQEQLIKKEKKETAEEKKETAARDRIIKQQFDSIGDLTMND